MRRSSSRSAASASAASAASCCSASPSRAALGLELGGFVDLAVPPEGADLLRHLVDLLAHLVAGAGQLPEPRVDGGGLARPGARSMPRRAKRLPHTVEVGAQQAGVDHDCRR